MTAVLAITSITALTANLSNIYLYLLLSSELYGYLGISYMSSCRIL